MIVVTGANGTIGKAVASQLAAAAIPVFAVSRDIFDLAGGKDLSAFVVDRPAAVIHLAAAVPHSPHYLDTSASAELTRRIDLCVYDSVRHWDCRVVYASTCSLYDKRVADVKIEETPILVRPDSPYMRAKSEGETLFAKLYSCAVMRLPAPIGPGLKPSVVAKRFFDLACEGKQINIWGAGLREQNYVDVDNIAGAMVKAASSQTTGIFNISADQPTTMLELATAMTRVIGRGAIEFAGKSDPLEYERTRYSNRRARNELGWIPSASLEDSIRNMLDLT
jgi:UDP-glucose 4-epimerase